MVSSIRPFVGGEFAPRSSSFSSSKENCFCRSLEVLSSLDPAQVLARETCLFSIRSVLNGHLFNLIIVRLLNPIDI